MIIDIPLVFIPIEEDGYHIIVEGEINDRAARLVIDTGASRSVFDRSRILSIYGGEEEGMEKMESLSTGISSNQVRSEVTILSSLKIGELILDKYKAVVIDMPHINETYKKLGIEAIDGIIGNDILQAHGAVIDYNGGVLELRIS